MRNMDLANAVTFLLDECNVSETEICRQTNLPRATIYRLKEGIVDPRLSTLKTLSDYFKIRVGQLIGDEKINKDVLQRKSHKVPFVQWSAAASSQSENNFSENNFLLFEANNTEENDRYIALKVFSDSMSPNFPPNTVIIIDKKQKPKNQDYVIASMDNKEEVVLRRLLLEGETKILQAINPAFPAIHISSEKNIVGIVVQARYNF